MEEGGLKEKVVHGLIWVLVVALGIGSILKLIEIGCV